MAERDESTPSDHESVEGAEEKDEGGRQLEKASEEEKGTRSGESEVSDARTKREERLKRLRELHLRRVSATNYVFVNSG